MSNEDPTGDRVDGKTPSEAGPSANGTAAATTASATATTPAAASTPGSQPAEDHTFDDKPASPRAKPRPKRGLRLPRRFRKSRPGAAAGIEPHELPSEAALTGATRIT